MDVQELIQQINKELAIDLPENIERAAVTEQLIDHINYMIIHHFEQLVSLLYRIDVSEKKISSLLQQQPDEDAARLIAALIIERQIQKIESRKRYSMPDTDAADEEKW